MTRRARNSDPETSHLAASSGTSDSHTRRIVLTILQTSEIGMTDQEIAEFAGHLSSRFTPSGLRSRRAELVEAGLVHDTGRRKPTETGRLAIIWSAHA